MMGELRAADAFLPAGLSAPDGQKRKKGLDKPGALDYNSDRKGSVRSLRNQNRAKGVFLP